MAWTVDDIKKEKKSAGTWTPEDVSSTKTQTATKKQVISNSPITAYTPSKPKTAFESPIAGHQGMDMINNMLAKRKAEVKARVPYSPVQTVKPVKTFDTVKKPGLTPYNPMSSKPKTVFTPTTVKRDNLPSLYESPVGKLMGSRPVSAATAGVTSFIEGITQGMASKSAENQVPQFVRDVVTRTQQQNPLLSAGERTLGEIASYIIPGMAAEKGIMTGLKGLETLSPIVRNTLTGALSGGLTEAGAGLVRGDKPKELMTNIGMGLGGGAILLPVLHGVGKVLSPAMNKVGNVVNNAGIPQKLGNMLDRFKPNASEITYPTPRQFKPSTLPGTFKKGMTSTEFDTKYGLNKDVSKLSHEEFQTYQKQTVSNMWNDTGKLISKEVGSSKLGDVASYYKQKYNLPYDIKFRYSLKNSKRGANIDLSRYNEGKVYVNFNPNVLDTPEQYVGAFRHEIEHYIDKVKGYKKPEGVIANPPKTTLREMYTTQAKGHHQGYDWFEADYLKKALQRDKIVKPEFTSYTDTLPKYKTNINESTGNILRNSEVNPASKMETPAQLPPVKSTPITEPIKTTPAMSEPMTPKSKYTPEIQSKLDTLDQELASHKAMYKNQLDKGITPEDYGKRVKGVSMDYAARKRKVIQGDSVEMVEGGFTAKELAAKKAKLETNYTGKKLNTPDGSGMATGKSSYGKVGVKLDTGEIKYYTKDQITTPVTEKPIPVTGETKVNLPPEQITSQNASKSVRNVNEVLSPDALTPRTAPKKPGLRAVKPGNVESGFSRNLRTDLNTADEIRASFDNDPLTHDVLSNTETLAVAKKRYAKGYGVALEDWNNSLGSGFKADDVPFARMLAEEAYKRGDSVTGRKILVDVADKLTIAGRAIQAAKILRQSDPKVFLSYLDRTVNKLNTEGVKKYGKKWTPLKVSNADEREILNMEFIDDAGRERVMNRMYDNIAEQMPSTKIEKWDAWRRFAMLSNPKTHLRNLAGNSLLKVAQKTADTMGAVMEKAAFVKTGERTKSFGWSLNKNLRSVTEADWQFVKSELKSEGRYGLESGLEIMGRDKRIFKTGWLNFLDQMSKKGLEAGDIPFLKSAYKDSLGQFMQANKLGTVTEAARDYAKHRALEATFRQVNSLSQAISGLKSKKGFWGRMVEAAIPFSKTPANILMRSIEYSPIGLAKGAGEMPVAMLAKLFKKQTGLTAASVIEDLSKGLTGTALAYAGFQLASLGWAKGKALLSKKAEGLDVIEGEQPYSIDTPFGSYTFDWAQPLAVPFTMGVSVYESLQEKHPDNFTTIWKAMANGGDTLFNMSMLKNIKDIVGGKYKSGTEAIMSLPISYLEQGFPTIGGQIARTMDTTKRSSYGTDQLDIMKRQMQAKIPGASKSLEPNLNIYGEEKKQGGLIEQFLSPGYSAKGQTDDVTKELSSLLNRTKEVSIIPKVAGKTFTYNGQTITFTPKEVTQLQRDMGKSSYADINKLIKSPKYSNASDPVKVKAISKLISDDEKAAKEKIADARGLVIDKKTKKQQTKADKKITNETDKLLKGLIK